MIGSPIGSSEEGRGNLAAIPVAPPATLVNPDQPVPMATVPAHINTASALTKQKLLQTIQMKEQQKFLEQNIARQLGTSSEILAQALKNMIPVSHTHWCTVLSCDQFVFSHQMVRWYPWHRQVHLPSWNPRKCLSGGATSCCRIGGEGWVGLLLVGMVHFTVVIKVNHTMVLILLTWHHVSN